jgi:hypothetical protein
MTASGRAWPARPVDDVEGDAAYLVAVLVRNQNCEMFVFEFRAFDQQAFGDQVGRIHGRNIIGQLGAPFVGNGF